MLMATSLLILKKLMELCNYGRLLKVDTSFLPDYANCNYFRTSQRVKKKANCNVLCWEVCSMTFVVLLVHLNKDALNKVLKRFDYRLDIPIWGLWVLETFWRYANHQFDDCLSYPHV